MKANRDVRIITNRMPAENCIVRIGTLRTQCSAGANQDVAMRPEQRKTDIAAQR